MAEDFKGLGCAIQVPKENYVLGHIQQRGTGAFFSAFAPLLNQLDPLLVFLQQKKLTHFRLKLRAAKAYDIAVYLNAEEHGGGFKTLNFGLPTEEELENARTGKPAWSISLCRSISCSQQCELTHK